MAEDIKQESQETPQEEVLQEQEKAAQAKKKKQNKETDSKRAEELKKLQEENKELSDRYLRMLAEYDNYRKRTASESERAKLVGITQALTAIFPVIDSINRALEVLSDDDKAMAGILQIKKQFDAGLAKLGVEQIQSLGAEFNPEYHNAVMQEEDADNAGKVIQVFQEGYKYKEFVIRPAMVKVAV